MKSQIPYLLIHTVYNIKKKIHTIYIYISCFLFADSGKLEITQMKFKCLRQLKIKIKTTI